MSEHTAPPIPGLNEREEEAFHLYLDETATLDASSFYVAGTPFRAAEVLKSLDPAAYIEALTLYRNVRLEQIPDKVLASFPGPIAYCFHMFSRFADTENMRLMHLRDAWEAVIRFIHALVLGEARVRTLDLTGVDGFKFKDVLSDSVDRLIQNIESMVKVSDATGLGLGTATLLGGTSSDQLRTSNRIRNGFSHSQALTEVKAGELIAESLSEFLPLLAGLEDLSQLTLMRVLALRGMDLQGEIYTGYSLVPSRQRILVGPDAVSLAYSRQPPYFQPGHMLAHWNDEFYCLAPFVHFRESSTGHSAQICLLRRSRESRGARKLIYDVMGESEDFEVDREHLQEHLNDVRALFSAGAEN
jgi:hypothetical protein